MFNYSPRLLKLQHARNAVISSQKRMLPKRKGECLFGVAPCLAALQSNRRRIHSIFMKAGLSEKKRELRKMVQAEARRVAEERKIDLHVVDGNALDRLSSNRPHQGIVLDADPLRYKLLQPDNYRLELNPAMRENIPLWLVLDEIQDPMNLGAVLRCAYFLGVERVVTTAKKCCPLSPVVSKASSGAMELMPVYSVSHLADYLERASQVGWTVMGTDSSQQPSSSSSQTTSGVTLMDCREFTLESPTILVLGNEGHGMRREVYRACRGILTIPPVRRLPVGFDSLNVAVATGILLHSLNLSRSKAKQLNFS